MLFLTRKPHQCRSEAKLEGGAQSPWDASSPKPHPWKGPQPQPRAPGAKKPSTPNPQNTAGHPVTLHCRLWLVTRTLGLRTGPPSLFTWLDSQLTKRVGRQTASCVCEDISRQDSLSSKTNPGCGWSTSRGRNSKE